MKQSANKAFRHFAGNRSLADTPLAKIQTLAAGYPFFPVAQFFLAKKLNDENDNAYVAQLQKGVLYFYNPFLFDNLLHTDLDTDKGFQEKEISGLPVGVDEEPTTSHAGHIVETFSEADKNITAPTDEEMIANDTDLQTELEPIAATILSESKAVSKPSDTTALAGQTEPDEHEKMFRSIKAMLDATTEEADADNTEIPLDPYYTIDYFASQGIKLDFEVNPQDQLGLKLKKFTHWLRHMKKLGPEDAKVEIENNEAEADIRKMADSSNNAREVVTEAMASVLEKQGKKEKAIELYRKLSFLNPDKSTYFAAQIEKLKVI